LDVTNIFSLQNSPIYSTSLTPSTPKKKLKDFDHSRYSTRLVALKLAYIGTPYQGFEYHVGCPTVLPTIEEKLFEALLRARLLIPKTQYKKDQNGELVLDHDATFDPDQKTGDIPGGIERWVDVDKWEYTKCGRTDRGVSAFGQVVGVRIRSRRPLSKNQGEATSPVEDLSESESETEEVPFDDVKDEFNYISMLNNLLPPTIRILAWCPNPPPSFSARFNCKSRLYRYFFTNPSLPPRPNSPNLPLDIEKMNEAANLYVGLHDFRNFCKQDASKQITNFQRRVMSASIEKAQAVPSSILPISKRPPTSPTETQTEPEMYYFCLRGSAFLWHQVRHMIAVLFLVGQGLEKPSIITEMLDVESVISRPHYEMSDDRPLVLWDCEFDPQEIKWVYPEMKHISATSREDIISSIWEMWHQSNLDAHLTGSLLNLVYKHQELRELEANEPAKIKKSKRPSQIIITGTGRPKPMGTYVPLLKRPRMDTIEAINNKFASKRSDAWRARWSAEARTQWATERDYLVDDDE